MSLAELTILILDLDFLRHQGEQPPDLQVRTALSAGSHPFIRLLTHLRAVFQVEVRCVRRWLEHYCVVETSARG